jgi:hypothetical protein
MTSRPILTSGVITNSDEVWSIRLSSSDPTFEEGMQVKLVLWDDREHSAKSEVEQIATTQQLDPSIVALALSAEGALKR